MTSEMSSVSLATLLNQRTSNGITAPECWALLFHGVQALQDVLLGDGANQGAQLIPLLGPEALHLTAKGRVQLSLPHVGRQHALVGMVSGACRRYLAPEYWRHGRESTDGEFEKMLVYSLGETLRGSVNPLELSRCGELSAVLSAMTRQLVDDRASLMHLLDVIGEYSSRRRTNNKPFSHTIMDLYRQTIMFRSVLPHLKQLATAPTICNTNLKPYYHVQHRNILPRAPVRQILPAPPTQSKWNIESEETSTHPSVDVITGTGASSTLCRRPLSLNAGIERRRGPNNRRQPVKRAASRLYKANPNIEGNSTNGDDCIGPEFVIRASLPAKEIRIEDGKSDNLKTLIVIMLNGVKLEVTCRPESTTAAQLFSKIVQSENIEENFFLGLSVLIGGDFVFVPSDTKLSKIISLNQGIDTLFVRVRFFLPSLRGIRSPQSRHLLYLQLRRSLLENQLPCADLDQLTELAGLALQLEFGDHTEKHRASHYFLLEHYIPEVSLLSQHDLERLRESLTQAHISRSGLSKEKAKESFISLAQSLSLYGFHIYSATWVTKNKHRDVWLCISAKGLNLYIKSGSGSLESNSIVQEEFKWQAIQTLCYSKHFLCILPHNSATRKILPRKYKLKMDHKKSYYAFRLASLHHQFFLRLRNEYSSLQPISQQFGVLLKDIKNQTNCMYKLGKFEKPETTTEFKILLEENERKSSKKNKCKRSKSVNELLTSDKNIEEYQNKENNLISSPQPVMWDKRKGVIMGTRAFSTGCQRVSRSLEAVNACNIEMCDGTSTTSSTNNILGPGAYVLNSSIKSCDEQFLPDLQETLSESLLNKLKNISFADERILKSVIIFRDQQGSLGIQVTEGSDNKAYIKSVVEGGAACHSRNVFTGDQIIAVDGHGLLNLNYEDALELLKNTGQKVEFVLSQEVPRGAVLGVPDTNSSCNYQFSKENPLNYPAEDLNMDKWRPNIFEKEPKVKNVSDWTTCKEIPLPRSLGLGRKWKGPVRYPVTPIKKVVECAHNDTSFYLNNTSDEDQIFI